MQFTENHHQVFVQVILHNNFSMIRVPDSLQRARKNSIDLFPELSNACVKQVYCIENERCLCLVFDQGLSVLIKMFGNQANIVLCREGSPFRIFRNNLKHDLEITMAQLQGQAPFNQELLKDNNWNFSKTWPVLGGAIKQQIENAGYSRMGDHEKWATIRNILQYLDSPEFFLYYQGALPVLSLFEPASWFFHTTDVIKALNEYYAMYVRAQSLEALRKKILLTLEKEKKRALGVMAKSRQRLNQLNRDTSYREIADILMANLHQIPAMATIVHLPDFKTGATVPIKLKATLSPQKNAENYYRKSKNQGKEIEILTENITVSQNKLSAVNDHIAFVLKCQEFKRLKDYSKKYGLQTTKAAVDSKPQFKEFYFHGFTILVGRNAANNDVLTQKYAAKDDLWLHARDVRGSHVIIKQVPGQPYPQDVIEKAAQLAAFHSKRKQDSLCPVIYTPRKYVRKPKGAATGEVIVDREKVILVSPETGSLRNGNFK